MVLYTQRSHTHHGYQSVVGCFLCVSLRSNGCQVQKICDKFAFIISQNARELHSHLAPHPPFGPTFRFTSINSCFANDFAATGREREKDNLSSQMKIKMKHDNFCSQLDLLERKCCNRIRTRSWTCSRTETKLTAVSPQQKQNQIPVRERAPTRMQYAFIRAPLPSLDEREKNKPWHCTLQRRELCLILMCIIYLNA